MWGSFNVIATKEVETVRKLISVATLTLALLAVWALLPLVTVLSADGVLPIFIRHMSVLALSVAGLIYWQRQERFGIHLLLGAWAIAVAAGIMASSANGLYVSVTVIVGVPIMVMLMLSLRKTE